ncbi:heterokaryon incompatibility protein-domain-containing protein [Whalleya microplaca]|nr:heterokaryon incompatibility protein-domain-containing protein [Whalleya microplaca]
MDSHPQCPSCAGVHQFMESRNEISDQHSNAYLRPTIGIFSDFQERQNCDVCKFLAQELNKNSTRDRYFARCPVIFWQWSSPIDHLWSFGPSESGDDESCIVCGQHHDSLTLSGLASRDLDSPYYINIDPAWIDLDRVQGWANHCWEQIPPPSLAPLLLVDVSDQCLVELPTKQIPLIRYVALSYVWGRLPNVLETTLTNQSDLKQLNAFSSEPWRSRLPDTVRDAIAFTGRLGHRYLWGDRLCIIQDDHDRKSLQLEQMGPIYANAYMTLIAADGPDANYGLRGSCPGLSQPRTFQHAMLTFKQGGRTLLVEPHFDSEHGPGEWKRRGWTFQERTLSRRNLVFEAGRVFWECSGAIWTEEVAYVPGCRWFGSKNDRKPSYYSLGLSQWPDLLHYERLVIEYNDRLLSFPSDGLYAFTGIINALSRSFRSGLFYGVPEYFFDFAMMWIPFTPIRRRLVNGKTYRSLPSWSWAGWEGGKITLSVSFQLNLHIDAIFGMRQAIDNGYYEAINIKNDKLLTPPNGWSRTTINKGSYSGEGFVHENIPEKVFVWPLHVPVHPLQPPSNSFEPFLRFRTCRAFVFVGSRLFHSREHRMWSRSTNSAVSLASTFHVDDGNGNWVGVIHSNSYNESGTVGNERCELIVICGGVTTKDSIDDYNGLEEWAQVEETKRLPTYEFYNVLWIHWIGNVAYRKASGRVWKQSWDRLQRSDVDITLG